MTEKDQDSSSDWLNCVFTNCSKIGEIVKVIQFLMYNIVYVSLYKQSKTTLKREKGSYVKRTHIRSNFFQLFWQAFIHDLPFTDIFIVFHTCINLPFWCLLIVNCRWYIFVRGFRRAYKWRGLYPSLGYKPPWDSQGGLYIFVRGFRKAYKRRGLYPRGAYTSSYGVLGGFIKRGAYIPGGGGFKHICKGF